LRFLDLCGPRGDLALLAQELGIYETLESDKEAWNFLAAGIECSPLTHLNLALCRVPEKSIQKIGTALKKCIALTHLDLSGTLVPASKSLKTQFLSNIMRLPSLEILALDANEFEEEHITLLSQHLTNHSSLTRLSLRGNPISLNAIQTFCENMRTNSTIEMLALDNCDLGDVSIQQIAQLIEQNSTLYRFGLNNNNIGNDGYEQLWRALSKSSSLLHLDILQNEPMDKKREEELLKMLESTSSPIFVRTDSLFSFHGLKVFESAIKSFRRNCKLMEKKKQHSFDVNTIARALLLGERTNCPLPRDMIILVLMCLGRDVLDRKETEKLVIFSENRNTLGTEKNDFLRRLFGPKGKITSDLSPFYPPIRM